MPRQDIPEVDDRRSVDRPSLNLRSALGDQGYRALNRGGTDTVPPEFGSLTLHDSAGGKFGSDAPGSFRDDGRKPELLDRPPGDHIDERGEPRRDKFGRITSQETDWGRQEFEYDGDNIFSPVKSMTVTNERGVAKFDRQRDGTYRSVSPTGDVTTYKDIEVIQSSSLPDASVKFVDKDGSALTRNGDGSTSKQDKMGRLEREYFPRDQREVRYEYQQSEDPYFPTRITTVDVPSGKVIGVEEPKYTPPSGGDDDKQQGPPVRRGPHKQ